MTMKNRQRLILLVNLGTPDAPTAGAVRRYLAEFLHDYRVVDLSRWLWCILLHFIILPIRSGRVAGNYAKIWLPKGSPLLVYSQGLADKLQHQMPNTEVRLAMRYGNPSTQSKVQAMVAAGCEKILFFPLYPHYAGATSATANDAFFAALMREKRQPAARTVKEYFDHPAYIEALAQSVERAYAGLDHRPDVLVTSYHGMPIRYLMEGDPYHCQCAKTSRLLRERLGWDKGAIDVTFQSVFGREEWLKPYTVNHVAELAKQGKKRIAVMAPAFSADCIETLEEINGEIRESFEHAGGEVFTYIPCLNDEAAHIAALTQVIEENLAGWI